MYFGELFLCIDNSSCGVNLVLVWIQQIRIERPVQMNETSNYPFDWLDQIVHLPISLSLTRPLHRVCPKFSGHTVVKSAFFCNSPSSPRNRRSASAIGSRTSLIF